MLKTKFGGGTISPAVANHLSKLAAPTMSKKKAAGAQAPANQFGGGTVSPSVVSHLAKQKQFGGGTISPAVAAHLAKRNIAKK